MANPQIVDWQDAEFTFDEFHITETQLFEQQRDCHITATPLKLLRFLIARRPYCVSYEKIMRNVWTDTTVSLDALQKAVDRARGFLGDDRAGRRFIETVTGIGYRFRLGRAEVVERRSVSGKDSPGQEPNAEATRDAHSTVTTTPPAGAHRDEGYRSFQDRLCAWGAPANDQLRQDAILTTLDANFVLGEVLLDAGFAGYGGVAVNELRVEQGIQDSPHLPDYVYERRAQIPKPANNGSLAFLEHWIPAVIDYSNIVTLRVGQRDNRVASNIYDYWTTRAVISELEHVQRDILSGHLRLGTFGRRLDVILTVVTADEQLVLAKRNEHVANDQGKWMASVGETVDQTKDLDRDGMINPIETLRRCLREHDELNLNAAQAQSARIRFLGLATEWEYMYANLLALVELPGVSFQRLKDRWSSGEHTRLAAVPFTIEACLPLIRNGFKGLQGDDGTPIEGASRMSLLLSLMSRFGYDEVEGRIG